jgi:hypothetical protein
MLAIEQIARLLSRCGNADGNLPPTALFNEGWMLRLVLDWAAQHRSSIAALRFDADSVWYSEARLPSRFPPRTRGDGGGEGFTHPDGVIGHVRVDPGGRGYIELLHDARQFVVVEAKMASGLSAGTKYAPTFNQAARTMACVANVLSSANFATDDVRDLGFVLLAPADRIADRQVFWPALDKANILETVGKRAESYGGEPKEWFQRSFQPVLERCSIQAVSWESVLQNVVTVDADAGTALKGFYAKCLEYNPFRPVPATSAD